MVHILKTHTRAGPSMPAPPHPTSYPQLTSSVELAAYILNKMVKNESNQSGKGKKRAPAAGKKVRCHGTRAVSSRLLYLITCSLLCMRVECSCARTIDSRHHHEYDIQTVLVVHEMHEIQARRAYNNSSLSR